MIRPKKREQRKRYEKNFTVRGKNRLRNNLNLAETYIELAINRDGYLMVDGLYSYGLDKIKQIRLLINNK